MLGASNQSPYPGYGNEISLHISIYKVTGGGIQVLIGALSLVGDSDEKRIRGILFSEVGTGNRQGYYQAGSLIGTILENHVAAMLGDDLLG